MTPPEKNLDVLQNLESVVVQMWRAHPEMTDHVAARAYEAAFEVHRAEVRGHPPKPPTLTGLDAEVFRAIEQVCEWRLGRRPGPGGGSSEPLPPLPVQELVDCLRTLRKSVERNTRRGGIRGYLELVARFVH